MAIDFEVNGDELILSYSPSMDIEWINKKLTDGDEVCIRHTFFVNARHIRTSDESPYDDAVHFCIGTVGTEYTRIDPEVVATKHQFFFANSISLKYELFIAYRNISILRKIDALIDKDFYIGGDWERTGGIPFEALKTLIKTFPKTAELDRYANFRIASCIKEFLPECDKYEVIYNQFIDKRSGRIQTSKSNLEIELAQFSVALDEMKWMLSNEKGITEKVWQSKVQEIILLLYPKYILCTQEVAFTGVDGYDKRPDFVLVDANGFIDILEIKKSDIQLLTKQASYRNNYVPVRELSGAIQQIEKYIFCLTSIEKSQKAVLSKLVSLLPDTIAPEIVNPQGILIAGHSCSFNAQQKRDFELIKRQYKHVADIMTYDDLVKRLENIVISLKKRIG